MRAAPTPADDAPRVDAGPRPADLALRYAWQEGSLPPPGHYRVTIRIDADGAGEVGLAQGYASDGPRWTAHVALSPADLDALWVGLVRGGLFADWRTPQPRRVGGSNWTLTVTASGATVTVPRDAVDGAGRRATALHDAVRAAVPEPVWTSLHGQRRAHLDTHRR